MLCKYGDAKRERQKKDKRQLKTGINGNQNLEYE
jgi:hypothetical protein